MNNAAVNILVQIFVRTYVFIFLGLYLGVESLVPMVSLCLTFFFFFKESDVTVLFF